MREKADALAALIEASTKTIKSLSLRNLLVIFLLVSIAIPVYLAVWFLQVDNRPYLLEVIGYTKIVALVDNCAVVRSSFQGKEIFAVLLTYNVTEDNNTFYMVSTQEKLDTKNAAKMCGIINENRDALREFYRKKSTVPDLPKLP